MNSNASELQDHATRDRVRPKVLAEVAVIPREYVSAGAAADYGQSGLKTVLVFPHSLDREASGLVHQASGDVARRGQ
jgi:hypothetical protein